MMSLKLSKRASESMPRSAVKARTRTRTLDDEFDLPVCGIDEVGRGPLAGPVVAACVYIPVGVRDHPVWDSVTDSKKLSAKKREELSRIIKEIAFCSIAEISP